MQGILWLAPFVLVVLIRRLDIDREWKTMADVAPIGCVLVCLVAQTVQAEP